MAYTPPLGDAVNFNATIPIIIPVGNAVNFNISSNVTEIVIQDSIIRIFDTNFYYETTDYIQPELSVLRLYSSELMVDPVAVVAIPTTVLPMHSSNADVIPCPDVIILPSIIYPMSMEQALGGNTEADLPFGISTGGVKINWEKPNPLSEHTGFNWENGISVDEFTKMIANQNIPKDKETSVDWNLMSKIDNSVVVTVNSPLTFVECYTDALWNQFYVTDMFNTCVWDYLYHTDDYTIVNWRQPGAKDSSKILSWDLLNPINDTLVINWKQPGAKDKQYTIPWGPISYFAYCSTKYFPPSDGIVNFKLETLDKNMIGVCMSIVFDVEGLNTDPRCPYHHYQSGRRDPYTGGGAVDVNVNYPYTPPLKEQYYMLNTVLVKRLPDNVPIEVTSINIKYDDKSWLWSFTLTIGKDKNEYLELIKPNPLNANLFTDIEIYINGWKWICRVESWDESRVFAKDSWRISGRSPSMELGYPQNPKTSYIFDPSLGTSSTAGGQIIDAVLEGTMLGLPDTNWSVDWSAYIGSPKIHSGFDPNDASYWGIKDGSFSWTDKTQIEVIKSLTDSIGAFIITNPYCTGSNKTLIVRPKFDQPPWYWNTANVYRPYIDHVINTSYAPEVGRNYSQLASYSSVYVMGQSSTEAQKANTSDGIVVVETYRKGIGPGDRVYAEDIVNPYIFNWQAALELGRMTICDTGEWLNHRLRLFSIAEYTDPSPKISRLILPGDFVQVNEKSTSWYGMSTSTEITANVVNNSAFAVFQTVEIKQYIGD